MGNSSNPQEEHLTFFGEDQHSYFNKVQVYQSLSKRLLFSQKFNTQSYSLHILKKLDQLSQTLQIPDSIVMASMVRSSTSILCVDKNQSIVMPYFKFTLRQLIQARRENMSPFKQGQIIYVASCLLQTFNFWQNNFNGNLEFHPAYIYLSPDGFIKIYLNVMYHVKMLSLYQPVQSPCFFYNHFLSPQQLLTFKLKDKRHLKGRLQQFSIGLTLLQMVTLQPVSNFYNGLQLDLKGLYNSIKKSSCGIQLKLLITSLLSEKSKHRLTSGQALEMLESGLERGYWQLEENVRVLDLVGMYKYYSA